MIDIQGMPVDERVKLMTAMLVNGKDTDVEQTVYRTVGAELQELALHAIRLLADARNELAAVKAGN